MFCSYKSPTRGSCLGGACDLEKMVRLILPYLSSVYSHSAPHSALQHELLPSVACITSTMYTTLQPTRPVAEVEGLKRKLISSLSPTSSSLITDWEVQHPCRLDTNCAILISFDQYRYMQLLCGVIYMLALVHQVAQPTHLHIHWRAM